VVQKLLQTSLSGLSKGNAMHSSAPEVSRVLQTQHLDLTQAIMRCYTATYPQQSSQQSALAGIASIWAQIHRISSIVQTVVDRPTDPLALSATIAMHIPAVSQTIAAVRATALGSQIKILVGGYAFNRLSNLWQERVPMARQRTRWIPSIGRKNW
jgi:hypothetical protein